MVQMELSSRKSGDTENLMNGFHISLSIMIPLVMLLNRKAMFRLRYKAYSALLRRVLWAILSGRLFRRVLEIFRVLLLARKKQYCPLTVDKILCV